MPASLELTVPRATGPALYRNMCAAIIACHKLDECKDIIDKSVAMAAYYAQINDHETELTFNRIKVRAWRRIGELLAGVDFGGCETQSAKIKKIRSSFQGDATIKSMSDSRLSEIVRLIGLSDKDFEYAINQTINGSISDLLRRTPQADAERDENIRTRNKRQEQENKNYQEQAEHHHQVHCHVEELKASADAAMAEIGLTLERKHRANLRQTVFLIKREIHETMRKAAFDKRITMQEVLRRGLKLWLEANGYEWPETWR